MSPETEFPDDSPLAMWPSTHLSLLHAVSDPSDSVAWERFSARYRESLLRLCRREFQLRGDVAEEVAQEVLMKLISAMQRFRYDAGGSFGSWLATVTRRTAIDFLRGEGRRLDGAAGGSVTLSVLQNVSGPEERLADALVWELRRELLETAESRVKSRLTEESTWAVYKGYQRGEPPAEIAKSLGVTLAAVYKAKSRFVEALRREISLLTAVQ